MKKVMPLVFALSVLITPCGAFAQQAEVTVNTVTTETVGTISEVSPDTIVVRSETNTAPTKYTYTKSTTYVDDMGNPVSMETVKSGLPVTIYYTQEGDQMIQAREGPPLTASRALQGGPPLPAPLAWNPPHPDQVRKVTRSILVHQIGAFYPRS